jgi:hypothetical protein
MDLADDATQYCPESENLPSAQWIIDNISIDTIRSNILSFVSFKCFIRWKFHLRNLGDISELLLNDYGGENEKMLYKFHRDIEIEWKHLTAPEKIKWYQLIKEICILRNIRILDDTRKIFVGPLSAETCLEPAT